MEKFIANNPVGTYAESFFRKKRMPLKFLAFQHTHTLTHTHTHTHTARGGGNRGAKRSNVFLVRCFECEFGSFLLKKMCLDAKIYFFSPPDDSDVAEAAWHAGQGPGVVQGLVRLPEICARTQDKNGRGCAHGFGRFRKWFVASQKKKKRRIIFCCHLIFKHHTGLGNDFLQCMDDFMPLILPSLSADANKEVMCVCDVSVMWCVCFF